MQTTLLTAIAYMNPILPCRHGRVMQPYPESVHADQIYRTLKNRRYCKEKGIRFSGPSLGRLKQATEANASELKRDRRIHRQDCDRR